MEKLNRLMLRPEEAAELIGFARTSIYALVKRNEIPHCKIGGSIRIPVPRLQEWAATKGLELQEPAPKPHRKRTAPATKRARRAA